MASNLSIIGGFLGAGKTTLINALATKYTELGLKIGIVTNDQGSSLVDTEYLKSQGFTVVEIEGGCFCCNFDQLISKVDNLSTTITPDIILAEPVGSCTDLISTIYKPLLDKNINVNFKEDFVKTFNYSPLCVVVDPKRVKRIMKDKSGFTNEINYLFNKQLEEANIILLNKIDLLEETDINEITSFLNGKYKGIDIIPISAKNDIGIEKLCKLLTNSEIQIKDKLNIDYNLYGEAEAQLGWLNCKLDINFENAVDINSLVSDLINKYKAFLLEKGEEIAHLKLYGITDTNFCKASLVSVYEDLDFNTENKLSGKTVTLIINARVNTSPDNLKEIIEKETLSTINNLNGTITSKDIESFKPGFPTPVWRL